MSKYSFEEDMMYLGTNNQQFTIIPRTKSESYVGRLGADSSTLENSVHLFHNASDVWILGGWKYYLAKSNGVVFHHKSGEQFFTTIIKLE